MEKHHLPKVNVYSKPNFNAASVSSAAFQKPGKGGNMKKLLIVSIAIISVFLMSAGAYGQIEEQQVVQKTANGNINWSNGIIQAKGIGAPPEKYYGKPQARPMAVRAAMLVAQRNLLEIVKGVQLDSNTVVRNFVTEDDLIQSQVSGIVKGAQVVNEEYFSDGTVEITMQMSLYGDFTRATLPKIMEPPPAPNVPPQPGKIYPDYSKPEAPEPPSTDVTPPVVDKPVPPAETTPAEIYTGLIVDARGLSARPAMAPKILDENGMEVYGSAFVDREYAVQQGMSGYSKSVDAAKLNQRVTDNPLIVKGALTKGPGRSDIVIHNADAEKLRKASQHLSFLKKCRVMIVVD